MKHITSKRTFDMPRRQPFHLVVFDRDVLYAHDSILQACAAFAKKLASTRVMVVSTFETLHAMRFADPAPIQAMQDASTDMFFLRSATDDCPRRTSHPVDWIEECIVRFVEEAVGAKRGEFHRMKKDKRRFDIFCLASSGAWRDALARVAVRSGHFVHVIVLLTSLYAKDGQPDARRVRPTAAAIHNMAKVADDLFRPSDDRAFQCERVAAEAPPKRMRV
jgi:hypothetical protein